MTRPELQDLIHRYTNCKPGECCTLMQEMEKAGILKLSTNPRVMRSDPQAFSTQSKPPVKKTAIRF